MGLLALLWAMSFCAPVSAQDDLDETKRLFATRQIELTDKLILSYIAAKPAIFAILARSAVSADQPALAVEMDQLAKANGLAGSAEFMSVGQNILLVVSQSEMVATENGTVSFEGPQGHLRRFYEAQLAKPEYTDKEREELRSEMAYVLAKVPDLEFKNNSAIVKKYWAELKR